MENNNDPLRDIEQQAENTTETKRTGVGVTRMLEGNFRPAGKKRPIFHSKNNKYYQLGRTYAMRGAEPELDTEWLDEEQADFMKGYTDKLEAMEVAAQKALDKKSSKKTLICVAAGVGGFCLFVIWLDGRGGK